MQDSFVSHRQLDRFPGIIRVAIAGRALTLLPLCLAAYFFCFSPVVAATVNVTIEGLEGVEKENALTFLEIRRQSERDDLSELVIRLLHRKAPKNIRAALRPFGYYDVKVVSELNSTNGNWRARYEVDRGDRVHLRSANSAVRGAGDGDPAFALAIEAAGLVPGSGLRHDHYDQLKRTLLGLALERGYFEARFTVQRLAVYPELLAADVELDLDTGPRYRFGTVEVNQDAIDGRYMRRYLAFAPGDAFDSSLLLDLQYALYDSEYFSYVEVSSGAPDPEARTVPVTVTAEPSKRQRYRFGIGYGTDTEARVSATWENRRVNRRGHKLLLDTRLSPVKQEVGGRYMLPLSAPARERLSFTGIISRETLADTRSRRIEMGVVHTFMRKTWERNVYLRALREESRDGATTDVETLLRPGVLWTRSKKDHPIYPRRGSRLSVELSGSHSALGSDVDFVQLRMQARLIRPAGRRSRILARAELGATSIGLNSKLPASLRFFAGGDQSVRGFGLNTLGPRDEDGLVTGGRYLFTSSLEYEHMLNERWGIALFADAGNALQDFGEDLEYSAGVGLRWRSPVGMIRLDVAQPLSVPDPSPRLHISVGAEL